MSTPAPCGPVLYTALVPLKVYSLTASWPCPIGGTLPLLPTSYSTQLLLGNGSIVLAAPGAVDTVTPPNCLRGQPGLKAPGSVSN
jgi:hypothetical protein